MPLVACQCGQSLNVPDNGGSFRCPKCQGVVGQTAEPEPVKDRPKRKRPSSFEVPFKIKRNAILPAACRVVAVVNLIGCVIGGAVAAAVFHPVFITLAILGAVSGLVFFLALASHLDIAAGIHDMTADLLTGYPEPGTARGRAPDGRSSDKC
jgi:hypothetical protein